MVSNVLQMFVRDEFTGLMIPNRKVRDTPLYFLCTEGGGIKCTPDFEVARSWLLEAVAKSGDETSHWIDEM